MSTAQTLTLWAATLKFKIVALAVVTGVVAAAGAGLLVLHNTQDHLSAVLQSGALDEREQTADLLASKVETLQSALAAVAKQVPQPEQWAQPGLLDNFLTDRAAIAALFDSAFIAGLDGQIVARNEKGRPTTVRPNIADREYFVRAMSSDQPVISAPTMGRASRVPIVVFAVPVLAPDGRAVAMLGGSLALQSNGLFSGRVRPPASDSLAVDFVVDRAGTIVSHSDASRILGRAVEVPGARRSIEDWLASGSPIDTTARMHTDSEYQVASVGIPLTDWMLVRVTPSAEVMGPLHAARSTAWKAALVAGLVAGLIAGALAFGLTRPISRLRSRALSLLDRGTAHRAWPAEQGEVGELSRVFEVVVQQRAQQQSEVQALVKQLEAVLDHADVGIALTRNSRFELVSSHFCRIFRCDKSDAVGQATRTIYNSDEAYRELAERARPAFMEQGAFDGELELVRRNGQTFWARMRGRAVLPGDLSKGTIWTFEDITAAREQREKLAYSATHDALTGLANRAAFEGALEQAIAEPDARPLCVVFIDLDRFKLVNDQGGHAAGDALLRDLAAALKAQVRRSDLVARLGGDEFAVLLPACPEQHGRAIADKLCAAVAAYTLPWEGRSFTVGASVGLNVVLDKSLSAADILRDADSACYVAKRNGRSRVEVHEMPVAPKALAAHASTVGAEVADLAA